VSVCFKYSNLIFSGRGFSSAVLSGAVFYLVKIGAVFYKIFFFSIFDFVFGTLN